MQMSAIENERDADAALLACDSHMHIFDARFPMAPGIFRVVPDFSVPHYRNVQKALGTGRVVVVQPSTYGTDNRCTLEAMARMGKRARGIAVVDDSVSEGELKRLHGLGIRGIRFNLVTPGTQPTTPDMLEPLAHRVAPLGWHAQVYLTAEQVVALAPVLGRLPVPVVFDHFARIPPSAATRHPALRAVADLLGSGRAWIKLSGAYHFSSDGPPHYKDTTALAEAYVRINPERLVWGSDWPHPGLPLDKPEPSSLVRLFEQWMPDVKLRARILVDNPAHLYGFPAGESAPHEVQTP
jgi:D-galactarolactone isomerase